MADPIPFLREFEFEYGKLEQVSPLVRRLVANNPGPFTFHGTGTYVIGRGKVAVVDAGPDDSEHVRALVAALGDEEVTHQLVTHTHLDHSPATRALKATTGARTYGYGPHGSGRYQQGETVEAGADMEFRPDEVVGDGDIIEGDGWTVECLHTPGHCSNHLCFALQEESALFSGDHVMGWSTTIVSPPDGNMALYMENLERLVPRADRTYYPTHGAAITGPQAFVQALLDHRQGREAQILACLQDGVGLISDMVPRMYRELPLFMHPAAARSVFAHVIHLLERGLIQTGEQASLDSHYEKI